MANGNGGRGATKSPSSSVQAVSHSRWRHIGTHIVSLVAFWGRSAMGWSVPFSLEEFLVEGPLLAGRGPSPCIAPPMRTFGPATSSRGAAAFRQLADEYPLGAAQT